MTVSVIIFGHCCWYCNNVDMLNAVVFCLIPASGNGHPHSQTNSVFIEGLIGTN